MAHAPERAKRPNILWISTHDIGPHLGCYSGIWPGAETARTPNLDRLAADGVRFDKAFATAPVCGPARSSIMTGCFPSSIGTLHMRTKAIPPCGVKLLPEYFRAAGYYTTCNWFTDFQVQTPPSTFDDCGTGAHWRNRPSPDTPFFAQFHSLTTHESRIYYDDAEYRAATPHIADADRRDPASVDIPPYHPDTPVFRRHWVRLHELITEMDHWAGSILSELEADGLAGDTIVVFWSDHGPGFPGAKRWANEAGLREPMIVRWPGKIAPNSVRRDVVHVMDIAPTMMELCGLPIPAHVEAKSLFDRNGASREPNTYAFGVRGRMDEQEDLSFTIRDARFRYISHRHPDRPPMQHCEYPDHLATWAELRRFTAEEAEQLARGEPRSRLTPLQRSVVGPQKPKEELYDIAKDPHSTTNLAEEPQFADYKARLRRELDGWIDRYGTLALLPEAELIERWRPNGIPQKTEKPKVSGETMLDVSCPTDGAAIVWTSDPPTTEAPKLPPLLARLGPAIGLPVADGRRWRLYTAPLEWPRRETWFRAVRLGFEPSDEVSAAAATD